MLPGAKTKTVFITTTGYSQFTVPSDFIGLVSVEAIGEGASSGVNNGYGAGGGAYAKSISVTGLTAGGKANCLIGAGGTSTNTWFNVIANSAPASKTNGVIAYYGITNAGGASPTSNSTLADVSYSGGGGGISPTGGGGGGGAGGPNGPGGSGGNGQGGGNAAGGGGGGADGGSAGAASLVNKTGGAGGNGFAGTGGGAGGTTTANAASGTAGSGAGGGGAGSYVVGTFSYPGAGATEYLWTQTSDGTQTGPGGGGGGNPAGNGGSGANYGGGGGGSNGTANNSIGGQGIIVFTYYTNA